MSISNPGGAVGPSLSQKLPLHALIASLPFSDFLQTGIVAFSAAPIMGDLGACPEEYSLISTLYAVVAIGMISMHRGWSNSSAGGA
jgi:hypothetical protein